MTRANRGREDVSPSHQDFFESLLLVLIIETPT